jgi:hypothetical protein
MQRKKEERLKIRRSKVVKAVNSAQVDSQTTFNQMLESNKEAIPPTLIITNHRMITVKGNELDRILEAENRL